MGGGWYGGGYIGSSSKSDMGSGSIRLDGFAAPPGSGLKAGAGRGGCSTGASMVLWIKSRRSKIPPRNNRRGGGGVGVGLESSTGRRVGEAACRGTVADWE